MRKLYNKIIFFGLFLLLIIPLFVQANGVVKIDNPVLSTSVQAVIKGISDWAWDIGFVLAPLMLIVGAFYLMTASGDPERINTGKKIITWTIIGIAVLWMSTHMITLIKNILMVK